MITAVCKIRNYGLTWTACDFADHHTENLQIFEVNAWVNLDLYGTLVGGAKNGWTDCSTGITQNGGRTLRREVDHLLSAFYAKMAR